MPYLQAVLDQSKVFLVEDWTDSRCEQMIEVLIEGLTTREAVVSKATYRQLLNTYFRRPPVQARLACWSVS